jgi:rhodanese-related sulfurtransferase
MAKQARMKAQQNKKSQHQKTLRLWGGLGIVLLIYLLALFYNNRAGTTPTVLPREISVEEAVAKREAGAFILDVRQPEEWNEFHVENSTLIPLGELEARMSELPKDQEIVIVCRSGNRSGQARDILLGAGFSQVTSMAGGLNQWKSAGYPTVSGP